MSQTASFLTDSLIPGLLCGVGLLGLGVVNFLGGESKPSPSKPPSEQASPIPREPAARRAPSARRPLPMQRAAPPRTRTASLDRARRPTRLVLRFSGRSTRLSDVARQQLRVFWAQAQPGPRSRVTVTGHGQRRSAKRRAKKRAARVIRAVRDLGLTVGTVVGPVVAPPSADAPTSSVTLEIGK